MIMAYAKIEQDMNQNCPLVKIYLTLGFLNINIDAMTWHNMMFLMQSIASKRKSETTLPASYGQRKTTVPGTSDKCVNEEGK